MKRRIRQHDRTDCGAACLARIAAHHGLFLPLTAFREACGTGTDGTSLLGLSEAAVQFGFRARALKSEDRNYEDLEGVPLPAILHQRKPDGWLHFVVLLEWNRRRARIFDPADGRTRRVGAQELISGWSGYLLVLAPDSGFRKADATRSNLSRLLPLFRAHRRELVPALLGSLTAIVLGLSGTLMLQLIIDQVLPRQDYPLLFSFGSFMLVLAVCCLIAAFFRSLFVVRAGIRIDGGLVLQYFRHLFRLPVPFFNARSCGDLNARVADIFRIRAFVSGRLLVIIISLLTLLFSFTLLFWFCWKLALISSAFIPLYILLYALTLRVHRRTDRQTLEAAGRFEEISIETLSRIRTAKHFRAENGFAERIEGSFAELGRNMYRSGRAGLLFSTAADALGRVLSVTVLAAGSALVFRNELSVGELVAFHSIAAFFTAPVTSLIESGHEIAEAGIAADRLFEILELPAEREAPDCRTDLSGFDGIAVENLSFGYPGRGPLLSRLDAVFPRGKITAVTGYSGCGKSTLAALLLQDYVPDSGRITVCGIDIRMIETARWRDFISIVPQQPDLFDGTLLENIAPGDPCPDLRRIAGICRQVRLTALLQRLPEQLESRIGPGGLQLSGGERQKTAIARALYRNPGILILDEATTHLDRETREEWKHIVRELAGEGKCIILISHDRESLALADRILDLEKLMRISKVDDYAPIGSPTI